VNGPIVVDVGNTRIKWGRCEHGRVAEVAALPGDDPEAWRRQLDRWAVAPASHWVVSGVQPRRRDTLVEWLRGEGAEVRVLDSYTQLPLDVRVTDPAKVGIDRLLNAVAANAWRPDGAAAVIVDAGSAVTVDLVDADGAFRGGAIFPGLRLMSKALHDYTALLPLVDITEPAEPPGASTTTAIRAGIFHAVLGGIERLLAIYRYNHAPPPAIYLTGGDAPLLLEDHFHLGELWPEMTLEGIRQSEDESDD
jgi:type III pantothenate kinase